MSIGRQTTQKADKSTCTQPLSPERYRLNVAPNDSALAAQRAAIAPELLSPGEAQQIQSAFGNRALEQMLAGNRNQDLRRTENLTGMPEQLKNGLESQSGLSMDEARVHYNSSKPHEINALAYTQGKDIYIVPGQEKHLPHEGWHVVQQMQGRVKPSFLMKGEEMNADPELEREAANNGIQACQVGLTGYPEFKPPELFSRPVSASNNPVIQRKIMPDFLDNPRGPVKPPCAMMGEEQPAQFRDYHDTCMLVEVLKQKYPIRFPHRELIPRVYERLNQREEINREFILTTINTVERELNLPETANQLPGDPFLRNLELLEGSFHWHEGCNDAFRNWLHAGELLPVNAQINCWEGVLYAAILAGRISKEKIREAYQDDNVQLALMSLFGKKTRMFPSSGRQNRIAAGDIIMLAGCHGPLSHVVAAVTPNQADLTDIMVMSLWTANVKNPSTAGGSFTKALLGALLSSGEDSIIHYASLTPPQNVVKKSVLIWRSQEESDDAIRAIIDEALEEHYDLGTRFEGFIKIRAMNGEAELLSVQEFTVKHKISADRLHNCINMADNRLCRSAEENITGDVDISDRICDFIFENYFMVLPSEIELAEIQLMFDFDYEDS